MDHVRINLGKKRMRTERDRLKLYFEDRPPAKILIEASTITKWVAKLLEELGHEAVADPNYAPMYPQRSRRVKTDKRDALALAEACRSGSSSPALELDGVVRGIDRLLNLNLACSALVF